MKVTLPLKQTWQYERKNKMIGMIAAVTKNGVIGVDNQLPFNYPEDMAHFRKTTANSIVIMGRNTYESIGNPLPKRRNIIVTRKPENYNNLDREKIEAAASLEDAINMCQGDSRNIWLIGGASIYEEGMKFADEIVLTLTPDIENRTPAVRFPWINPSIFKLSQLDSLNQDSQLLVATYKK